jgi:hypothetical protein
MSWLITPTYDGLVSDADATAYLAAVQAADGQLLEPAVRIAVNNFIVGCKTDGIWDAIKASCILAGARTLTGALVPLVGTAPTNFNFGAGDYNRKTGLKGNGTSKYLNANRLNNAESSLNSKHISVYATEHHTRNATRCDLGTITSTGGSELVATTTARFFRVNINSPVNTYSISDTSTDAGFWGASRTSSTTVTGRYNNINTFLTGVPSASNALETRIFARDVSFSDARLAFYSIGESLNLALLDARVTTLVNAFAASIP